MFLGFICALTSYLQLWRILPSTVFHQPIRLRQSAQIGQLIPWMTHVCEANTPNSFTQIMEHRPMRNICFVAGLTSLWLSGATTFTAAQPNQESQLLSILELSVKPGMIDEYEAGRKRVIERWAENDFSFPAQISVDDSGVYRQVSFRGGWADFERYDQENQALPGDFPAATAAVDHVRQSILRTRPDLSYVPANPRFPNSEAAFIRYVFIHLQPGQQAAAAETMRQISALRRRHDIQDGIIVTSSVVGHDSPMLLLRFHARDVEDYYAQRREIQERLGDEFTTLVRRMGQLARRIETSNNVWRRDLSYQPAN